MVNTGQFVILEKIPMMTGVSKRFEAVQKKKQKFPCIPNTQSVSAGCDKYCPADSLLCSNGSGRTEHPMEIILETAVEPVRGRGGEGGWQGATTSHAEAWRGEATQPDGFSTPTAGG
jgi:hypothetical protein